MKRIFPLLLVGLVLFGCLFTGLARAQEGEDEFSEESEETGLLKGIRFEGFVEIEQGLNITGAGPLRENTPDRLDWMMAFRRFRIQTSKTGGKGGVFVKVDLIRDEITNKTTVDIRELRLQYRLFPWMDIWLGRQVSTWGVGDMLFINDLFPKNWVANFQGRDMELMKNASTSLRLISYFKDWTFDVVYHPKFSPDTTPSGCYFSVYDPNTGGLVADRGSCGQSMPSQKESNSLKYGELAVSLKKRFGSQEIALYGYTGSYKNPRGLSVTDGVLGPYYPDLKAIGASSEGQLGPGIFSAEIGYYYSPEDKDGTNPLIENSYLKYLLGYKVDVSAHLALGVQWYRERMMDYEAYSQSQQTNPYRKKQAHNTFTLRVTYKAQQETLWVNLFSYIRPEDKDTFTRLDISKRLDDHFAITLGANVFTGKARYEDREFGMMRHDDNIYLRFKYNF